jgi:hypothetical protein
LSLSISLLSLNQPNDRKHVEAIKELSEGGGNQGLITPTGMIYIIKDTNPAN